MGLRCRVLTTRHLAGFPRWVTATGGVRIGLNTVSQLRLEMSLMPTVLAVSTFGWLVIAVIWIALAFWPARVAGRKGHSFLGFFILSICVFPLAVILAYAVEDRTHRAPGPSPA